MNRNSILFLLVFSHLLLNAPLTSAQIDSATCLKKVCFEKQSSRYGLDVPLRGVGLFTYWTFEVYTGALYAPDLAAGSSIDEAILGNTPKVLVLEYHRSIRGDDFRESTLKMIEKNPTIVFERIRDEVLKLNNSYVDVQEGDRYALRYIPNEGTTLYLNDKPLGTFQGEEFARAVFGIWLSNYSVGEDFTNSLLGKKS